MKTSNEKTAKPKRAWVKKLMLPVIGLLSFAWFAVRVIPKPSRAMYPCQRAAFPLASAFVIWLVGLGTTSLLLSRSRLLGALKSGRNVATALAAVGLACFSVNLQTCTESKSAPGEDTSDPSGTSGDTDTVTDADNSVVAIVQSSTDAESLSLDQIRALVTEAVTEAGGLGFITDGQNVVLKPNLVTTTTTGGQPLPAEANGVTTDWRIALSVAELVRAENPSGQILVMEGSVRDTENAFQQFGYTPANFGNTVDEFVPIEGSSCFNPSTDRLVQATASSGTSYWVDDRFLNADVVISLPVLKTHLNAGITGAIKNIGIGMIPAGKYKGDGFDCTRSFDTINHDDPVALSQWIRDIYSLNPADFSVMDGLRGLANGPEPSWVEGGDYATDVKNMRLILASDDAVALDTTEALVMGCDPTMVPMLQMLSDDGMGTSDPDHITVVGKPVSEVSQPLEGSFACPGPV
jgi:uncharacterized protein (DUF362 family)